jgi:hypothetical protein
MEIYCRACGCLIKKNVDLMNTTSFKEKYGDVCPHCKISLSVYFNIIKTSVNNDEKRLTQ